MADIARDKILAAAVELRLKNAHQDITVETVAKKAGCAKGLVAYHFKTKELLFAAVDEAIGHKRLAAWKAALDIGGPQDAIDACWKLVHEEAESQVAHHAAMRLTDWSGSGGFSAVVGQAGLALLKRAGRLPTVSDQEIADLCAVTLPAFATARAAGADLKRLEGAYLAFWAALFALTRPA